MFSLLKLKEKSGKRDSDPRPQPWQGCALPTELFPQKGSANILVFIVTPKLI